MLLVMLAVLMAAPAMAQVQTIEMKTNDFFIVQFVVDNPGSADVRNCVPIMSTSDFGLKDGTTFSPEVFDLGPGLSQVVSMRIDDLEEGYYSGELSVKCELYREDELADIIELISSDLQPQYEILVAPAGEGQDYVFIPVQSYNFIGTPGGDESASFSIANTGSTRLEVDIVPQAEYQDVIDVTPRRATINPGDRQSFLIEVAVPQDFEGFETNLTVQVGDYTESFPIIGQEEGLNLAATAVAQNLLQGTVSAGDVEIPTWAVVLVILLGSGYLFREDLEKLTKRRKRK